MIVLEDPNNMTYVATSKHPFLWTGALLVLVSTLDAQPTNNMLMRTTMIEAGQLRGTAFSIDVDGREYWITAKHILTGASGPPYGTITENKRELRMFNPGAANGQTWIPFTFTILQIPAGIDIAVLVPDHPLLPANTLPSPPATTQGLTFGGFCEFLGFAYGGGWRAKLPAGTYWMPFIKHCSVSGMDLDSHLLILDGINNSGFSGGPVIFGTGADLKIAGVISGYHAEPTEVIRGDVAREHGPKDIVNLNSGFILAYDILPAIEVIKKNPIGPKRGTK